MMRRIGFLSPFPRADVERLLLQVRTELEKLGWVDGRNIAFLDPRLAEGRNERLPTLAAEIVAQNPDMILVQSAPATRALMQATRTIPIVMVGVGNPVEYGIVTDYAKPGGNVTGLSYLADESTGKLLQVLREAVPRLRSVTLFVNPTNQGAAPSIRQLQAAASAYGMRAQIVEVSGPGDFEPAFAAIRRERTESILLPPEPLVRSKRDAIGEFALRHGLALAVVGSSQQLPAGGLIAYAPAFAEFPQGAARYVDRLLKGAKPGELPVEQPTRFELVVNLKTAKTLGLTIPPSLLATASEVIQ
jgi:putative ABC transport system substrate-binding protein